jgi:hypothetical protein
MKYACSVCGRPQETDENWRVGFENTGPATSGIEKTIVVLHRWDEQRAEEPNAVHFCSEKCEQEYLAVWYGEGELAAA